MGSLRIVLAIALIVAGCRRATETAPPAPTISAAPAPSPSPTPTPTPVPVVPPTKPGVLEPAEPVEPPLPVIPAPGSDPDFPAKRKARAGDWLAHFNETGQTLEEYVEDCTNRRAEDRKTIVIQPLGEKVADRAALLEQVRAYGAIYFGVDVKVDPAVPLPKGAWDAGRKQCDGDLLLRRLEALLPGKTLAFVGLLDEDLWSGNLNFVFGVATLRRRCGVYSLARYGGDGEAKALVRTLKVFTHETGHILGMEHCVRWECVMNGSNSLDETDRAPLFPCPECHAKLRWNTGFDSRRRWEGLATFLDGAGLPAEAVFARKQAAKPSTDPPAPSAR